MAHIKNVDDAKLDLNGNVGEASISTLLKNPAPIKNQVVQPIQPTFLSVAKTKISSSSNISHE